MKKYFNIQKFHTFNQCFSPKYVHLNCICICTGTEYLLEGSSFRLCFRPHTTPEDADSWQMFCWFESWVPAVSSENSYLVNVKMICTKAYCCCFYSVQNVTSASDPMEPQMQKTWTNSWAAQALFHMLCSEMCW